MASEGKVGASHRAQVGGDGGLGRVSGQDKAPCAARAQSGPGDKGPRFKEFCGSHSVCPLGIATKEKVT